MSRNKFPQNTPARIFLVMGDEDVTPEDNFLELDEITWCSEKVFKTDIEYVRKDLYDAVKKKLEKAESDLSYSDQYNPMYLNGRPDII